MLLKMFGLLCSFFLVAVQCLGQARLHATWNEGLEFRSDNDSTVIKVGGRLHYDLAYNSHDAALDSIAGNAINSVELRRLRLSFEGIVDGALEYEFEFTFGEEIRFGDLYLSFLKLPFFEKVRIGHFREPFGMEENTTSNSIVFMERSLTSSFGPGRNVGLMLQKPFLNERLRLYAGVFRITNSRGSDLEGNSQHSVSSRIAAVPLLNIPENEALHLGASSNFYSPVDDVYELNVENPTHTGGNFIKSGTIPAVSRVYSYAGELGYSIRQFCFQGEYMHSFVRIDEAEMRQRDFNSFYAQASYFFGMGRRSYDKGENEFSDISVERTEGKPYRGAWEVGLRYARVHLKESVEEIKKMHDITFGLNWYYNKNIRLMANQIFSRIQDRYSARAFQVRVQVAF